MKQFLYAIFAFFFFSGMSYFGFWNLNTVAGMLGGVMVIFAMEISELRGEIKNLRS